MFKPKLPDWLYKSLHGHYQELPGLPIKNPDESGNKGSNQRNSLSDVLGISGATDNNANSLSNNLQINETDIQNKPDEQSAERTVVLDNSLGDLVDHSINNNLLQINSQIINLKNNNMNIFQNLGIVGHKVLTWVRAAIIPVNAFVNNIKAIEQTPQVQSLEQVLLPAIDGLFPVAHIPAIIAYVPTAIKALGWVTDEAAKTDKQILDEGLAALKAKLLANPDVYALWLHNLNSMVTVKSSALSGVVLPIQEAIKSVPLVHEDEKQPTSSPVQPVYTPFPNPQQLNPVDQKAFDTVSVDKQGEKVNAFVDPASVLAE